MREFREDRRPADLWFWNDWFSSFDVRSCSLAAQGLWVNMLGIMSRAETKGLLSINGKPLDSKGLAKVVGVYGDEVERLLIELEFYKVFSRLEDGTIYNRRMYRESEISKKRSEAGRLGGLKQNQSKPQAKGGSKNEATLESEDEDGHSSSIKEKDFDLWWSAYPRKVAKKVAAKAYAAAIKAGAAPEDLARAVEGYRAELKRNGTEERYCLHASTFLHDERWRDYLDIKAPLQVGEHRPAPITLASIASLRPTIEREARAAQDALVAAGKLTRDEADAKVRAIVEAWEREMRGKVKGEGR